MRTLRQIQTRIQAASLHRAPGFVNVLTCIVLGALLSIETMRQGGVFFG